MIPDWDRWFGKVDLRGSLPASTTSFAAELNTMLDQLQPRSLDIENSRIGPADKDPLKHGVVAHLAHATDPNADIDITIDEHGAIVSWLSAHEHILASDGDAARQWTSVVVDAVASILRGELVVDEYWCGKRLTKVHIIDIGGDNERELSSTGSLLAWLPWRRPDRVERRAVSFDVRN